MKAAMYLRVSTEEQRERQTIATQRAFAASYSKTNDIFPYGWYEDDGVSGTVPLEQRPAGARLLADARAGKINAVYIYKLDRLAREGIWLGGIVPYGYRVMGKGRDSHLVISEQVIPGLVLSEADIVCLIFYMTVEEGKSCFAIADYLNALGV